MAAVNGEDRVVVIGETPVNRALPEPGAEYDRLAAKYKQNTENGQEYVAIVYGVGQRGVEALAREIRKAHESASAPPVQGAEYDSNDDPLRGLFDTAPPAASVGAVEIAE